MQRLKGIKHSLIYHQLLAINLIPINLEITPLKYYRQAAILKIFLIGGIISHIPCNSKAIY